MQKFLFSCAAAIFAAMGPACAEQGDWVVRTRALLVAPLEESSNVLPSFPNGSVAVDDEFTAEIDVSYFFLDHFAIEGSAALPTKHSITGEGDLAFLGELAQTKALASVWSLQFHPFPEKNIRPYIGIGANWARFVKERPSPALTAALGPSEISLDQSFGILFQAGADITLTERFFANFDIKYLDIDTVGKVKTPLVVNSVEIAVDPLVVGVGLGARF